METPSSSSYNCYVTTELSSTEQKSGNNDREKFQSAITTIPEKDQSLNKFERLDEWLRNNGAKYPSLELRDYGYDEVRGCHATQDIAEDQTIIYIPLKCLITVEMGKDTDVSFNFSPYIIIISYIVVVVGW